MKIPTVVAHRGYALRYPENTLAAVRAAIDAGARFIEVDVQLTADAYPVLFHDRTLKRVCGTDGAIHEKTLKELRKLRAADTERFGDCYGDEPIATLQDFCEVLAGHLDVRAFLEIKRVALERFDGEKVIQAINSTIKPVSDRCTLISFSTGFLASLRQKEPGAAVGAVVDRWEQLADPEVQALRADYVFCDLEGVPATGPLSPPDRAQLVIYEVAEARVALELAERGVDFVETFACAEMLDSLLHVAIARQRS
ncbi:MAG: glycerophosphodiester phosphodiesterase family protein [Chromatiales bacterium]